MCQELSRIKVRESLASTKRLKASGARRYVRIYTVCKHDIEMVYGSEANGKRGWRRHGQNMAKWFPVENWPAEVQAFLRERIMAKPKPKKKTPVAKEPKLLADKRAATAKLAEWTRKGNTAATKVRQYATKLRRIERQIAAQQTAGIAGAASRSFDFDE